MQLTQGRKVLCNRYSNAGVGRALQQKLRADKEKENYSLTMCGTYKISK